MNLIIPADGEAQQVAADLLSLAESPAHVATNTDAGLAFVVPDYLAALYAESLDMIKAPEKTAAPRRGRTRKES